MSDDHDAIRRALRKYKATQREQVALAGGGQDALQRAVYYGLHDDPSESLRQRRDVALHEARQAEAQAAVFAAAADLVDALDAAGFADRPGVSDE